MKLDINLLETTYVSTEKSIPIVVKISSDDKIEIAEKVDLKEILLLQNNEPRIGTYTIISENRFSKYNMSKKAISMEIPLAIQQKPPLLPTTLMTKTAILKQ
ncbi:MAG: hypothetical protein PHN47_08545 [Clostridia bacterium]|nr:hypothetical protein [Clostridia bacterium]